LECCAASLLMAAPFVLVAIQRSVEMSLDAADTSVRATYR
jgi:hypothetical protein